VGGNQVATLVTPRRVRVVPVGGGELVEHVRVLGFRGDLLLPAGDGASAGVGVLVGVWRRVSATSASLALAAPTRQVQQILDTAGLSKILPVYDAVRAT
jgi:hypothetical protein